MPLDTFHFLRPEWLYGLIPLAILIVYWVKKHQAQSGWSSTIDDQLLNVLLEGTPRRRNRWLGTLLAVGLICATVGLAGPTWKKLPQSVEQKSDALIILLDLSLSMLAQDIKPSRIERARQKITDVLRLRKEGQTALIAYAGDAHIVVPLTDDTATITNLLAALSPDMMPVYGSNLSQALELTQSLFDNSFLQQGRILIVTDGIDDANALSTYRSRAYPISIIGIGSADGGAIPLDRLNQPGRFLQTDDGRQIIATLDVTRLETLADKAYGRYATAVLGDSDLTYTTTTTLPSEDDSVDVEREFDTWFDQGHWAFVVLIPLVLWGFRKGVLLCALLTLALPAPPAFAAPSAAELWESLWQRADQRGVEALRTGKPNDAVTLFNDHPAWQSIAHYRNAEYPNSLSGFQSDASVSARYNEGNALARLGEYAAAIEQYKHVLSVYPDHSDATFNKNLVEKLLEQQQQAQQDQQDPENQENQQDQQDNQQQQNGEDQGGQQEQSSENPPNESENASQEAPQEPQEQESQEPQDAQQDNNQSEQELADAQAEQTRNDEKQDALEQWLRRVPDKPGGLLRRKFSHETKQRLRRGEYENREGEKVW